MSIIKLALYGAVGYLVYQTFFAEHGTMHTPRELAGGEGRGGQGARGGAEASRGQSVGGTRMTGGGQGQVERTDEPTGESVSHRVGRGVR